MKRLAIPGLILMLVLGMTATAMAISDGTYDYYGTFYFDARYADGDDTCSFEQFGKSCPLVGNFCITDLVVSGGGATITGPADAPYGVAVDVLPVAGALQIALQGDGQINLTVGDSGNDLTTAIDVGEMEAGCGTKPCLNSWTSTPAVVTGTPADVVGGIIPYADEARPSGGPNCAGGPDITYGAVYTTTETVTTEIDNELGSYSYSNTMAGGLNGLDLTISAADGLIRTVIFGQTVQDDTMIIITFDGTLCDASQGSCAQNCPQ